MGEKNSLNLFALTSSTYAGNVRRQKKRIKQNRMKESYKHRRMSLLMQMMADTFQGIKMFH